MSTASSVFASHARSRVVTFECALECRIGAYSLREGDGIKAVENPGMGTWKLYVEWAEGYIASVPAASVNHLAGRVIVEDEQNFHFARGK